MIRKDKHAIEQGLRNKIESGEWPNGSRLPSSRELAQTLGISRRILREILSKLEEDGLVERRPKSGVISKSPHRRPSEAVQITSTPRESRNVTIARAIIDDIAKGRFRVGDPLPQQKTLKYQYKTSAPSLGEALRFVKRAGLIHRRGPNFYVGPELGSRPTPNNLILAYVNSVDIMYDHQVWLRFLMAMEPHAVSAGMRIETRASWDFKAQGGRFLEKVPPETVGIVCVVKQLHHIIKPENTLFQSEIRKALEKGLPVVVFGIAPFPNAPVSKIFGPCENLYLFDLNDMQAGAEVAAFGMARGHRDMAFFGFSDSSWIDRRFEGVQRMVLSALDPQRAPKMYRTSFDQLATLSSNLKSVNTIARILAKPMKQLLSGFQFSHSAYYRQIGRFAWRLAARDLHYEHMFPLFERALKQGHATLWVCADSTVAQAAAEFLEQKKLRIPKDIHLITMDDNSAAMRLGVTAQSFQVDRMGYLAVHAIAGDIPIKRKRNRVVICPHAVIDRGSVGRA